MTEVYNLKERAIIISVIYGCSLIIALLYLCCSVDLKRTSCILFILALIYASLFIFLNIIATFDLIYNNQEGFEKLFKFIKKFYWIFNKVDLFLGFIIFTELIFYLESGQYSWKKLLDYIFRNYNKIKKMTTCQKILIPSIAIPLLAVILTFSFIHRNDFGLGYNPLNYISVISNCYGIFEIYTCVGFFIIQYFMDCRRRNNYKLQLRYYRYSMSQIIIKTNKYMNKIKNSYGVLNNEVAKFDNNDSTPYHTHLQKELEKMREKINELEGNNTHTNITVENAALNYNVTTNNNIKIDNINQLNNNPKPNDNNNHVETINIPGNKEEQKQKIEINEEKETDLPTCIRKYKKAVRRIDTLTKLYKYFSDKEKNININTEINKKKSCWAIIFSLNILIVLLTDFIIPIAFVYEYNEDFINDDEYEKEESVASLVIGVLFMVICSVLTCSYTIIIVYSTTRRRYITGDFLSG